MLYLLIYIFCNLIAVSTATCKSLELGNLGVYWGQNSLDTQASQGHLIEYCKNSNISVIPLAFVTSMTTNTATLNFANQQTFIGSEISQCQNEYNKTILLSIGGSFYSGSFKNSVDASRTANMLWNTFGPLNKSVSSRPWGNAVINGFNLDFEESDSGDVEFLLPFAKQLRSLMDSDKNRTSLLTLAPTCGFMDPVNRAILNNVRVDALFVQLYNSVGCDLASFQDWRLQQQNNLTQWGSWAKNHSSELWLGIAGGLTAAKTGYVGAAGLRDIIQYCQNKVDNFGGVMIWDASQAFANAKLLASVKGYLDS